MDTAHLANFPLESWDNLMVPDTLTSKSPLMKESGRPNPYGPLREFEAMWNRDRPRMESLRNPRSRGPFEQVASSGISRCPRPAWHSSWTCPSVRLFLHCSGCCYEPNPWFSLVHPAERVKNCEYCSLGFLSVYKNRDGVTYSETLFKLTLLRPS